MRAGQAWRGAHHRLVRDAGACSGKPHAGTAMRCRPTHPPPRHRKNIQASDLGWKVRTHGADLRWACASAKAGRTLACGKVSWKQVSAVVLIFVLQRFLSIFECPNLALLGLLLVH